MAEQLLNLLKIAGSLLLFITVWMVSIAVVFRDINRRRMNGYEQFIWLAVTALIPLVGFLIYWVARMLTQLLLPEQKAVEDPRIRITAVREAPQNIPRAPLYQQPAGPQHTMPAAAPAQPAPGRATTGAFLPFPTRFVLIVVEGPYLGGKFHIAQFPARIGRGSSVLIQLNSDQGVSRQHAEILTDASGFPRIRDLNSMHGTYVNGQRVAEAGLALGDRITVGQTTFLFSEDRG